MPKVVRARKVIKIRTAPVDSAIKVKTANRTRTKSGRAASTYTKTSLNILKPDPTPTPSDLPDLYPENPPSDDEREVLVETAARKTSSKAVSVSFPFRVPQPQHALNSCSGEVIRVAPLEGGLP